MRKHLSTFVLLIAGLVLIGAGTLKVIAVFGPPTPDASWTADPATQVMLAQAEVLLGIWLLTGWKRGLAWLAALSTFLIFAASAAAKEWVGAPECGCFGRVKAPPLVALAIDVALILALLSCPPKFHFVNTLESRNQRGYSVAPLATMVVVGNVLLWAGVGWANWSYGSLSLALSTLRGDHLALESQVIDLGRVRPGEPVEVEIRVRNISDTPVYILGTPPACSCRVLLALPALVKPGQSLGLPVRVVVSPRSHRFATLVHLWTDSNRNARLQVQINGIMDDAGR